MAKEGCLHSDEARPEPPLKANQGKKEREGGKGKGFPRGWAEKAGNLARRKRGVVGARRKKGVWFRRDTEGEWKMPGGVNYGENPQSKQIPAFWGACIILGREEGS